MSPPVSGRTPRRFFGTVARETLAHYNEYRDDEGELGGEIVACDNALSLCLDAQAALPAADVLPPETRAEVIDALFAIWQTDVEIGGIDLSQGGTEAIARAVTDEERAGLERRLRALIQPAGGDIALVRTWLNRAALGFLDMLLSEAGLSDEQLVDEYTAAELWDEAAATLLRLGRTDEAVTLASRKLTQPVPFLAFAD